METEFERVALDLFIEHGYRNVSIEQIADVAGVSARTFYRYFPAKEDLLGVLPRRLGRLVCEALLDEPLERSAYDALTSALLTMLDHVDTDELARWLTVTMTPEAPSRRVLTARMQREQGEVEALLARHMSPSPTNARYTLLLFSAAFVAIGSASREWFEHGGDLVTIAKETLDVFGRGLSTVD